MSAHRASRSRARRRTGLLFGALALSVTVAAAAVGLTPRLGGDVEASAASAGSPTAVERASLAAIDPIPSAKKVAPVKAVSAEESTALPSDSGSGRRIVFDQGDQRVWLVGTDGTVDRTYRVSGSRFDNLRPGSYAVQSRARQATAFDASGSMEYFVRFATGVSEPIGFHSVPVDNAGALEQTKAQLGTPLSAGCVRQWKPDAIALWDFAPVGTPVVVTA